MWKVVGESLFMFVRARDIRGALALLARDRWWRGPLRLYKDRAVWRVDREPPPCFATSHNWRGSVCTHCLTTKEGGLYYW